MIINEVSHVNIEELISECMQVLHFKAEMKGLKLISIIDSQIPKTLTTDPKRLS
jgi:hypothetical protein